MYIHIKHEINGNNDNNNVCVFHKYHKGTFSKNN